jgi:hypothetical protein
MLTPCTPKQNYIPATLADADYERLLPILELIPYESGSRRKNALAGNKGAVGIVLFTGGEAAPNSPAVQNVGHACRLNASLLKREFRHSGPLRHLLLGLHAGVDRADGTDRCAQPEACCRAVAVPLAALERGGQRGTRLPAFPQHRDP